MWNNTTTFSFTFFLALNCPTVQSFLFSFSFFVVVFFFFLPHTFQHLLTCYCGFHFTSAAFVSLFSMHMCALWTGRLSVSQMTTLSLRSSDHIRLSTHTHTHMRTPFPTQFLLCFSSLFILSPNLGKGQLSPSAVLSGLHTVSDLGQSANVSKRWQVKILFWEFESCLLHLLHFNSLLCGSRKAMYLYTFDDVLI